MATQIDISSQIDELEGMIDLLLGEVSELQSFAMSKFRDPQEFLSLFEKIRELRSELKNLKVTIIELRKASSSVTDIEGFQQQLSSIKKLLMDIKSRINSLRNIII